MSRANNLYDEIFELCKVWECRRFTLKEKLRDFFDELLELFEAVKNKESKEEIGLEYGDILFSFARHGKNENKSRFRKFLFIFLPKKHWLEKKIEIFKQRDKWWMENHGFHSIRNYKNKEKREKLLQRRRGEIPKDTWIP